MVEKVAAALRQDIAKLNSGDLLGSEDELLVRYGVSRPTLRQAAGLVSQQQLLTVRRGVNGGYYTRTPDVKGVSQMAAIYLQMHGAELPEVVAAFLPIRVEIARLAATCRDEELRRKLVAFVDAEKALTEPPGLKELLLGERRFNTLMGRMSGNRALMLFVEILSDLAVIVDRQARMFARHPDRMIVFRREMIRLAESVIEGEADFAELIARRRAQMVRDWILKDLARRTTPQQDRTLALP